MLCILKANQRLVGAGCFGELPHSTGYWHEHEEAKPSNAKANTKAEASANTITDRRKTKRSKTNRRKAKRLTTTATHTYLQKETNEEYANTIDAKQNGGKQFEARPGRAKQSRAKQTKRTRLETYTHTHSSLCDNLRASENAQEPPLAETNDPRKTKLCFTVTRIAHTHTHTSCRAFPALTKSRCNIQNCTVSLYNLYILYIPYVQYILCILSMLSILRILYMLYTYCTCSMYSTQYTQLIQCTHRIDSNFQ